jgi:hypothetical protein
VFFSLGPFSRRLLSCTLALATLSFACIARAGAHGSAAVVASSGPPLVARYADALGTANARLPRAARRDLAERVLLLSSYYKLDPYLLGALVSVESAWRSRAISPVGAMGYGQLMPGTAASLDVNALEPYENLDGTARYLRRMLNRFAGRDLQTRMKLALASYNAGPAAVTRYRGIPPYRETHAYVANVLRTRRAFVAAAAPARADLATTARRSLAPQSAPHAPKTARPDLTAVAVAIETPPPVRYETSRSFVARFLGLRHRVPPAPSPTAP